MEKNVVELRIPKYQVTFVLFLKQYRFTLNAADNYQLINLLQKLNLDQHEIEQP